MSQPVPDVGPPVPDDDVVDLPTADEVDGPAADLAEDPVEPGDADTDRPRFRLAYVPGATPGKWARVWRSRLPDVALDLVQLESAAVAAALKAGEVDAAVGRLPVDKDVFSAIPLYEEVSVVCVSRDHLLAALGDDETVTSEDIAEDPVWVPADDVLFAEGAVPGTVPVDPDGNPLGPVTSTAEVVATVAANVGVAVLPMSLARLHHRKDVTYRLLADGPTAPVGLIWQADRTTDLVEELIGIVRGRTVNSSRGRGGAAATAAAGRASTGPVPNAARTGVKKSGKAARKATTGQHGSGRSSTKSGGHPGVSKGKSGRSAVNRKKKGKGR